MIQVTAKTGISHAPHDRNWVYEEATANENLIKENINNTLIYMTLFGPNKTYGQLTSILQIKLYLDVGRNINTAP